MVSVPVHDWRPGDRVATITVSLSTAKTGLGTIQRVILDKAIIVWDDGKQSTERLIDLIIAGHDPSKIILMAESVFGQPEGAWWGDEVILTDVEMQLLTAKHRNELLAHKERIAVNAALISGLPLVASKTGIQWGS